VFPLPGVSQPLSFLLLLIGAAKRPSVAEKPITVVGERKQSKSSKACCRCEDRFTDIDCESQELIRISIGWFDLLVETYWLV
jgi:hypothetical protein